MKKITLIPLIFISLIITNCNTASSSNNKNNSSTSKIDGAWIGNRTYNDNKIVDIIHNGHLKKCVFSLDKTHIIKIFESKVKHLKHDLYEFTYTFNEKQQVDKIRIIVTDSHEYLYIYGEFTSTGLKGNTMIFTNGEGTRFTDACKKYHKE